MLPSSLFQCSPYISAAFERLGDMQALQRMLQRIHAENMLTVDGRAMDAALRMGILWSRAGSRAEYINVLDT